MATMPTSETSRKRGRGRKKIEIEEITDESRLQVTFSKRRAVLFKKASELCTLCDAEIALIIFSPGGKIFSFGHPNVEAIIQRYLSEGPNPTSAIMRHIEAQRSAHVRELNLHL